jgi:hypothetical protein
VDTHGHVQRLVSVVIMATVLQEYTTAEQCSVVHFSGQMDSGYSYRNVSCLRWEVFCNIKQFRNGLRNSLKDVHKSQMMYDQVALLRL